MLDRFPVCIARLRRKNEIMRMHKRIPSRTACVCVCDVCTYIHPAVLQSRVSHRYGHLGTLPRRGEYIYSSALRNRVREETRKTTHAHQYNTYVLESLEKKEEEESRGTGKRILSSRGARAAQKCGSPA